MATGVLDSLAVTAFDEARDVDAARVPDPPREFDAARAGDAARLVDADRVEEVALDDDLLFDELLELLLLPRVDEPALFAAVLLRVPFDLLGAFSVIYIPR